MEKRSRSEEGTNNDRGGGTASSSLSSLEAFAAALIALNREVYTYIQWNAFRFRIQKQFEDTRVPNNNSGGGGGKKVVLLKDCLREPEKFPRHCRELLGKWILSQKAREVAEGEDAVEKQGTHTSFFADPTKVARFCSQQQQQQEASSSSSTPAGGCFFFEQLLRDLSLKCNLQQEQEASALSSAAASSDVISAIRNFLKSKEREFMQVARDCSVKTHRTDFTLAAFFDKATHTHVDSVAAAIQQCGYCPVVSCAVHFVGKDKLPSRSRLSCDAVRVAVQWNSTENWDVGLPKNLDFTKRSFEPPFLLVPFVVWERLVHAYSLHTHNDVNYFSSFLAAQKSEAAAADDHDEESKAKRKTTTPPCELDPHKAQEWHVFALRAVTLIVRYEMSLSTGSLQLCADTTVKDAIYRHGYHVIDLCASPINAYATPLSSSSPSSSVSASVVAGDEKIITSARHPNSFCSAFHDTDCWFGSLGSALLFDPIKFLHRCDRVKCLPLSCQPLPSPNDDEKARASVVSPLVLTLDVPYDEDLCEFLYRKLARDCVALSKEAAASSSVAQHHISWILVQPLWWDLRFKTVPKHYLPSAEHEDNADEEKRKIHEMISRNSSYLRCGHVIDYKWMSELEQCDWVSLDLVFVKGDYAYFDTSTSKLLKGVTATEVIAVQTPEGGGATSSEGNSSVPTAVPPLDSILRKVYAGCKEL